MKATLNDFINQHQNCKKFEGNQDFGYVFSEIFSSDKNIIAMVEACENGKPALSACISDVETYFDSLVNPEIDLSDDFTKTAIGRCVKTILKPFGYEALKQKNLPKSCNSKYIASATTYVLSGKATMRIVKTIVEC